MRGILDYVLDCQASFEAVPFNEVDACVLCQASYMEFEKYVPGIYDNKHGVHFKIFNSEAKLDTITNGIFDAEKNKKLINALRKSRRFAALEINNFKKIYSINDNQQFCAMTFEFGNTIVVTFRGTDMTITGWHEDFVMLYSDEIPAQKSACDYLEFIASKTTGPIIVCGHSKGGNLAIYSSMKSSTDVKNRIIHIYDFDGPGFKDDVYETEEYQSIKNKVLRRICDKTIIGMLMYYSKDYEVIKTSSVGIFRHILFNWHINHSPTLRRAPKLDMYSKLIAYTVTSYLEMTDLDERKDLVDLLFNLLKENPDLNMLDLRYHFPDFLKSIKRQYDILGDDKQERFKRHYLRLRRAMLIGIKKGLMDGSVVTRKSMSVKKIKIE
ncbi:MAG: DUF2974 domain-containing protein [Acholeplasmatales bacterium]|nr:DUF2974 domain-containing protein [Acholeplasmatales bacterium]